MKRRSGFGWMELVEGIFLIILGICTFVRPNQTLTAFVMLYGVAAIIMGIEDILLYVRVDHFTGFGPTICLISGTLSVMAGVMLLVYPGAGKRVLSMLFPLWFIAHCISRLSSLNVIRFLSGQRLYLFTLVLNIIGLVLGIFMLIDPWFSLLSVRVIVGVYLILLGIDCIAIAFSGVGAPRR